MSSNPTPAAATPKADPPQPAPRRRNPWLRALKWIFGIIIAMVLLLVLTVGAAVWILTPERLTPLVEKYGSEYIDGSLTVKRVELTYWKTFPRLQLDVDSLDIVSHSLRALPAEVRQALPANSDSLLSVSSFSGGINILELLRGRIALYDIDIVRPKVNIVQATPELSNFNIFPASEEPDTTSAAIPDFSFTRINISGDAPISYVSLPDTVSAQLTLRSVNAQGTDAPTYTLSAASGAKVSMAGIDLSALTLGLDGSVVWRHSEPYKLEINSLRAAVNALTAIASGKVDFSRDLTISALSFSIPQVPLDSVTDLVPAPYRSELSKLKSTLSFALEGHLTRPYTVAPDKLPSFEATLTVPEGTASYEQLKLNRLAMEAAVSFDGESPDLSLVTLRRLLAVGQGVGFELKGTATSLLSDPLVDATFKGGIDFSRLPSALTSQIGGTVSGSLRADADFTLRQSWLSRESFHRIKARGEASLHNFRFLMPEMDVDCFLGTTEMKFGTSSSFVRGDVAVDSLLTVSLKVDTLAASVPGMQANGSALRLGAGVKNTTASADTTQLTPIGAMVSVGRFRLLDTTDSTRYTLRDVKARASVRRFRESKRKPVMSLNIDAKRLRYADRLNRANLTESNIALTVHPSVPRIGKKTRARIDSLRALYPNLPPDSVYRLAMSLRPKRSHRSDSASATPADGSTLMDYGLDAETKNLMRQWSAAGSLKAKRARVFTPYFPLRNTLKNVDLTFNNDSVVVNSTRYTVGRSDFLIDGTITNITRAMTSRTGRQPLRINFVITSDTIDVNQIAAAAFAGAAFAEKERQGLMAQIADSDNDNVIQASIVAQTDSTDSGPLLIPTNVEATLRLNARNVLYSDFLFHNLRGSVEMADGILNMRNLSARTDVGAVDLTALYEGIDPADLSFAFGMNVRDFRVGRFLDLVPSLDTIMPLLNSMDGIINGQVAAQARLDSLMDVNIPSLNAAVSLQGDSLVLLDAETFRSIGKWLLFKNKQRNVIDSMQVKLVVKNSVMQLYPFMFDIDRYRLGVYGNNDLDLNFKYHIAVLKSPVPFKFGINVSGNADDMKIRLGGAKWDEKSATRSFAIADTARINLVNQIQSLFRRGVKRSREAGADMLLDDSPAASIGSSSAVSGADTISHADSLVFIREGLLPAPPEPVAEPAPTQKSKKRKK
ncbi:MAG: hypothetical protein HDS92_00855 [Bacteroidales bacterium]|nr:hypothetical protein [Bacteroidales bacterium]